MDEWLQGTAYTQSQTGKQLKKKKWTGTSREACNSQ
jgi:hypothetical protein